MKFNFLLIAFIIYPLIGLSQQNCRVEYSVETTANLFDKDDYDLDDYDKKINEALKENAPEFKFILKIQDNESYFYAQKTMSNDRNSFSYKIASIMFQAKKKYYLNIGSNEKLTEIEAFGKKYILRDSINNWKITKEQKKIDNYLCYKAITKKVTLNGEGEFITDVIVWFTTEIPYSFGPIGYGGLPGLILELQDGVNKYRLSKLNYVDNIKISKPSKGKLVTDKELLEISERNN